MVIGVRFKKVRNFRGQIVVVEGCVALIYGER